MGFYFALAIVINLDVSALIGLSVTSPLLAALFGLQKYTEAAF